MSNDTNDSERQTPDDLHPVVLVIQRDPQVVGKERLELVAHDWNKPLDHVEERLIREVLDTPIPFGTAKRLDPERVDFYAPGEAVICDTCFTDKE